MHGRRPHARRAQLPTHASMRAPQWIPQLSDSQRVLSSWSRPPGPALGPHTSSHATLVVSKWLVGSSSSSTSARMSMARAARPGANRAEGRGRQAERSLVGIGSTAGGNYGQGRGGRLGREEAEGGRWAERREAPGGEQAGRGQPKRSTAAATGRMPARSCPRCGPQGRWPGALGTRRRQPARQPAGYCAALRCAHPARASSSSRPRAPRWAWP